MITNSEFYKVSDNAHFLFGFSCVLLSKYLFLEWTYGFFVVMVFATIKEFYLDPKLEDKDVAGSGIRDWLGYLLGCVIGCGTIYLKNKWAIS